MPLLPQISVGLLEPVLARRIEHVHIERILQRMRLVRHVARQMEHLARAHHDLFGAVVPHQKPQRTLQDVGQLLVHVRVLRDDAALLQVHVGQHQLVAGDQTTGQELVQILTGNLVPAIPCGPRCSLGAHDDSPRRSEATTLPSNRFSVKTLLSASCLSNSTLSAPTSPTVTRSSASSVAAEWPQSIKLRTSSIIAKWPSRSSDRSCPQSWAQTGSSQRSELPPVCSTLTSCRSSIPERRANSSTT